MALRKEITYPTGLTVDSYCRIDSVSGSTTQGIQVVYTCYAYNPDGEQAQFEGLSGDVAMFPFDPDPQPQVSNLVARAYEMLKTLPEFADAVDV